MLVPSLTILLSPNEAGISHVELGWPSTREHANQAISDSIAMKLLYIAHFYPPCGGSGVQRTTKFIKYLPTFGVSVCVLTGQSNLDERWSPKDLSFLGDIPSVVREYRVTDTATNIFDHSRGKALLGMGRQAIADEKPDLILVTLSPFEDAEVAARLSAESGIPWVADLRDPWALDEFQVYKSLFHRLAQRWKMKRDLATASGIIMNTPFAKKILLDAFPSFRGRSVTAITNGFDPEDFPTAFSKNRSERFRIVHTGTFHSKLGLHQRTHELSYRILRRSTPGVRLLSRSPYYLLQALAALRKKYPWIACQIEVVFAGVMGEADLKMIDTSPVGDWIEITGYVDHQKSADYVRSADLLFLPLHERCGTGKSSIVPGKTYEYIASGIPVLGALPPGDARDFVEAAGNCWLTDPSDAEGIEAGILHFFAQWQNGSISYSRSPTRICRYDRKNLTGELVRFLTEVKAVSGGSHATRSETHIDTL